MLLKFLAKPLNQYLVGALVNILFLALLLSNPVSYNNLQVPQGTYAHNIWEQSDVTSYVNPAANFVHYGVFGKQFTPDYFRTIGYPFFISIFMFLSPLHWLILLLLSQCLLFALLYPLVTKLAVVMFRIESIKAHAYVFIANLLSGVFFTRSPSILTDLIFILFLYGGIYFGFKYFRSLRWGAFIMYVSLITIAGLIRPTGSLFLFINIMIGIFVSGLNPASFKKALKPLIVSTAVLLISCNISTYRNIINYNFYSPSSVIGINSFEYVANYVLTAQHREDEYLALKTRVDSVKDINQKVTLQKHIAKEVCLKYPASAIQVLMANTINVMLDNHLLNNVFMYFGYTWKVNSQNDMYYKKSQICYYGTYFFMFIYFIVWILFFKYLLRLFISKQYTLLLLILSMFLAFLAPAIITGGGGSRFRLPVEFCLILSVTQELIYLTARKHDI